MIAIKKKKTTNLRKHVIIDKWYTSCSDLPLYNFIKITVTGDVNFMRISGTPPKETLKQAWELVQGEYQDLAKDSSSDYLLNIISQISYLDERLRIIYNIVASLELNRSEGLISLLRDELGFYYEYSEESLPNDLKMIIAEIKSDHITLDLSVKEYEEYKAKGKPATEVDYDKLISRLSKYQGYQIKSKEVTVSQFVAILNDFSDQNKQKQLIPTDEN